MTEDRHGESEDKHGLTQAEEHSLFMPRKPAQQDPQLPHDEPWKFLCLAVALILFMLVIILGVVLIKVLSFQYHLRDELKQLDTKFLQGLADDGHRLDTIRGETFHLLEDLWAGNGSSCEPCPKDWFAFEGSCYMFSTNDSDWHEAQDYCSKERAHLVIINSQEEQNFLSSKNGNKDCWIGLRRRHSRAPYLWEDGSNPTFTNWKDDQHYYNYMYMEGKSGHWTDYQWTKHWICEKPQFC